MHAKFGGTKYTRKGQWKEKRVSFYFQTKQLIKNKPIVLYKILNFIGTKAFFYYTNIFIC